ncbi:MAG: permease-like cell division protein FtsX [Oscillospiraceae bacterium]|nr:permease-like cell division protein FtsX [Oscillospiraceae bacterium]
MKLNRIGYYIKEGLTGLVKHGFMSFASVFIIVACLLIMGSFSLLALNVNAIIKDFEDENVVLAFIDEDIPEQQARALESQILSVPNVASAEFISREEAYESFISKSEEKYADLDASVLRHRFAVYLDDVALTAQTQQDLRNIPGVAEITANLSIARGIVTVRNVVSAVSMVLVVILLIISFFIMSNTIKLATVDRREEIGIMKVVGATNAFIRWPFVLEGFILGIAGALIAFVALWALYTFIAGEIVKNYTSTLFSIIPFSSVQIPILVIFLVIGFAVGVLGSSFAIKNYLKV